MSDDALRIMFCGTGWFPVVDAIRAKLPRGAVIRARDPATPLAEAITDAHVILPSNAPIDAAALAAAPGLRLIQQPAVGYENIDLAAARARGVPVCNAPGVNPDSVAQAALLLMLALARRLPAARRAFAQAAIGVPVGIELGGQVLGIVGLGQSGSRLGRAAAALGMEVVGVRSRSGAAELDALFARADFVSLHCPLTAATRGLIGDHAFARMKPGAFLINCARAAIVDRGALDRALALGKLGGVGLDTHFHEPWDPDDPLFAREDVVALPHIAGSTHQAFGRIADIIVANLARLAAGEPLLNRIA